jgi:hypothetical protein
MATKIWYPEMGDSVRLLDGSLAAVSDQQPDYSGSGDIWQVHCKRAGVGVGIRQLSYNLRESVWEEQDD